MLKYLFIISACIILNSCELFDYGVYDGRLTVDFRNKNENIRNISLIETSCVEKDTIRFIWFGDTGRHMDELKDFVKYVNNNDLSVDFAIHAGDITEFGTKREYEWAYEIMTDLHIPYLAIIGNHDIIGGGDKIFRELYGNENFSFIANDILFICLNTNMLEYDNLSIAPDFDFLNSTYRTFSGVNETSVSSLRHTVAVMHAPPLSEQFYDKQLSFDFQAALRKFPSLLFCLHGHTHNFSATDIFNDKATYYACDDIGKRTYLIFTITPDNYFYEIHKF
jgi:Icc-related predicted phosphoesterase